MVLTFKSTTPERRVIIEKNADGRERIAVATTSDGGKNWNCRLTHPDGSQWEERYSGPNVVGAMGNWMDGKRHEYLAARNRGDRPEAPPFDRNRPINEAVSPIIPTGRR